MGRPLCVQIVLVAAVLVLGPAGRAPSQEHPEDEARSLGAAALLLAGQVTDAELARWADLLGDARPRWRATGARLAMVSGAPSLVPPLLAALEKETDPAAAREEMLALGALSPGTADETLFQAARRFSGDLDGTLARALALRGDTVLAVTPRLAGRTIERRDWDAHFAWATADGRRAVERARSAALATGEPRAWAALLEIARQAGHVIDDATLARSLEDPSPRLREETYWHLLMAGHSQPAGGSVLASALAASPEAGDDVDGVGALGYELLARTFGRSARDWTSRIESLSLTDRTRLPRHRVVLQQLSDSEHKAYGLARFGEAAAVERRIQSGSDSGSRARAMRQRATVMRTVPDHPAGLPEALMSAAGCAVEGTPWAALQVHHDSQGELDQLGLFPMEHLSPACQRVARVLLLTSLVPGDHPPQPDRTDILMQPLFASFFSCVAEQGPASVPAQRLGGPRIVEPRKVHDVRPAYPSNAKEEGRQGVVILEAVVGPSGCVRSVQVLRGSSPDLDAEALRTVAQWRYTPTLLNGVPVPVIMTVTVNFKLS